MDRFGQVLCFFGPLNRSGGHRSFLDDVEETLREVSCNNSLLNGELMNMREQPWFHGDISKEKVSQQWDKLRLRFERFREQAEEILKSKSPGCFIVRCSTTVPGQPFTISKVGTKNPSLSCTVVTRPVGESQQEG